MICSGCARWDSMVGKREIIEQCSHVQVDNFNWVMSSEKCIQFIQQISQLKHQLNNEIKIHLLFQLF